MAIEFALILPVLLLLIIGILEFAALFHTQMAITHATREGVRIEALSIDGLDATEETLARMGPTFPHVQVAPAHVNVASTCSSSPDPGDVAAVRIVYEYSFIMLPINNVPVRAQAVMRCGG